jgi:hypothetical protein
MAVMDIEVAEVSNVPERSVESSAAAVEWAAIIGGAVAAVGISIILFTLGAGFGLSNVSPWSFANPTPTEFAIGAGIWLIVMQWLSSALGGYLTGRLRTKWVGIRTDEVFFRDTAHGFLAWALATLIVAALIALGSTLAGAAGAAGAAVTPGAEVAAPTAEALEQARQVAKSFSFYTSLSLLIGAFIGAASGALGGFHRDET